MKSLKLTLPLLLPIFLFSYNQLSITVWVIAEINTWLIAHGLIMCTLIAHNTSTSSTLKRKIAYTSIGFCLIVFALAIIYYILSSMLLIVSCKLDALECSNNEIDYIISFGLIARMEDDFIIAHKVSIPMQIFTYVYLTSAKFLWLLKSKQFHSKLNPASFLNLWYIEIVPALYFIPVTTFLIYIFDSTLVLAFSISVALTVLNHIRVKKLDSIRIDADKVDHRLKETRKSILDGIELDTKKPKDKQK